MSSKKTTVKKTSKKKASTSSRKKKAAVSPKKKQPVDEVTKTITDFKRLHSPDPEVIFLRKRISELEAMAASHKSNTGEMVEIIHSLHDAITEASPVKMEYRTSSSSKAPCTHVLHLTDLHYGEVTEKDEVDGFGEFSPTIAEERLRRLTETIISKTKTQRAGYNVPTLHVIGTADYISGDIHQELLVNNAFPSPVQAVRCGYILGGMLAAFAPHFKEVKADLLTLDNHGRMTRKPQCSQGGLNNWSYVVAEIAKQHVRNIKNVTVDIHAKPTALIAVGPERYLAFHGHQIRGWSGKPYYGFDRRVAMEAVKRMGVLESAFTKLLLGHFHHAFNGDNWIMGGSLNGTTAFDHSCGRHSKPHQTSWFVHPTHGEFDWTRWWLD